MVRFLKSGPIPLAEVVIILTAFVAVVPACDVASLSLGRIWDALEEMRAVEVDTATNVNRPMELTAPATDLTLEDILEGREGGSSGRVQGDAGGPAEEPAEMAAGPNPALLAERLGRLGPE